MIYCCCNQASDLCADTCCRWRGTAGPDHVFYVDTWPKKKAAPSVKVPPQEVNEDSN